MLKRPVIPSSLFEKRYFYVDTLIGRAPGTRSITFAFALPGGIAVASHPSRNGTRASGGSDPVAGNTAWIGGIIRNSKGGVPIDGTVPYFYVIDNGESASDPVDRASAVRLNDRAGEDIAFCTNRPLGLVATDIAHGNVQVR